MRRFIGLTACVAVAACGGTADDEDQGQPSPVEDVAVTNAPEPTASPTETETPEPAPKKAIELSGTGLTAGSDAIRFDTGRSGAEATMAAVMGKPTGGGPMPECGAGPMVSTDYAGGLTLNFLNDKFVGWNLRPLQDGDSPAPVKVSVSGPAQLGSARSKVEAASGFEMFDDSTLGDEFSVGDVSGFFENGKVSMLYSGTQCFYR